MHFREILSPVFRRYLILIETIYYSRAGASSEELLKKMKCSMTILLKDIKFINSLGDDIRIVKHKGLYQLEIFAKANIKSLYSKALASSIEFQLIEAMLFEEHSGIVALADHLFTSPSNVQRYLKKLERLLKNSGIKIQSRPLRLEGDEGLIRQFYDIYFSEKQKGLAMDFPKMDVESLRIVKDLVLEFLELNDFAGRYVLERTAVYNITISLWRIKNDHFFPKEKLREEGLVLPRKEALGAFGEMIKEKFDLEISEGLIKDVMWQVFSDSVILNKRQMKTALNDNKCFEEVYNAHLWLATKYNEILDNHLSLPKIERIASMLTNELYVYTKERKLIINLRETKERFIEKVSRDYPKPIEEMKGLMKDFVDKFQLFAEKECWLTYTYLLLTGVPDSLEIIDRRYNEKVHLLFITDLTDSEERYLEEYIYREVHGNFQLHHFGPTKEDDLEIWEEILKYDGLITTFNLTNFPEDYPILVIDSLLNQQMIERIQEMIRKGMEQQGKLSVVQIPLSIQSSAASLKANA